MDQSPLAESDAFSWPSQSSFCGSAKSLQLAGKKAGTRTREARHRSARWGSCRKQEGAMQKQPLQPLALPGHQPAVPISCPCRDAAVAGTACKHTQPGRSAPESGYPRPRRDRRIRRMAVCSAIKGHSPTKQLYRFKSQEPVAAVVSVLSIPPQVEANQHRLPGGLSRD